MRDNLDTGVDNIEHFFWLSESGFDYRPEAVSRMDPSRQTINATYFGPDRDGFANYEHIDDVPKDALLALRNKYWFYREAADAGLMVTSSSDAGVRDTPFDGFALTVIAGMIAMDDTPVGAIYRATLAPARAIGRDDELGSLERGKVADVFVVKGDASEDLFALRRPLAIYLGGLEVDRSDSFAKNPGQE